MSKYDLLKQRGRRTQNSKRDTAMNGPNTSLNAHFVKLLESNSNNCIQRLHCSKRQNIQLLDFIIWKFFTQNYSLYKRVTLTANVVQRKQRGT